MKKTTLCISILSVIVGIGIGIFSGSFIKDMRIPGESIASDASATRTTQVTTPSHTRKELSPAVERTITRLSIVQQAVGRYYIIHQEYPDTLNALVEEESLVTSQLSDVWGTPFRYEPVSKNVFRVISAGVDQEFSTSDDISLSSNPQLPR